MVELNPVAHAIDTLFSDQARRHGWLLEAAEQRSRSEEVREAFAKPSQVREPVGDRSRKIARILARDGDVCCYCKAPLGDDMTLEHRIAQSRGGSDDLDNLKLAHGRCNAEVGNLPPDMKDELARRNSTRDGEFANNGSPNNQ